MEIAWHRQLYCFLGDDGTEVQRTETSKKRLGRGGGKFEFKKVLPGNYTLEADAGDAGKVSTVVEVADENVKLGDVALTGAAGGDAPAEPSGDDAAGGDAAAAEAEPRHGGTHVAATNQPRHQIELLRTGAQGLGHSHGLVIRETAPGCLFTHGLFPRRLLVGLVAVIGAGG